MLEWLLNWRNNIKNREDEGEREELLKGGVVLLPLSLSPFHMKRVHFFIKKRRKKMMTAALLLLIFSPSLSSSISFYSSSRWQLNYAS